MHLVSFVKVVGLVNTFPYRRCVSHSVIQQWCDSDRATKLNGKNCVHNVTLVTFRQAIHSAILDLRACVKPSARTRIHVI